MLAIDQVQCLNILQAEIEEGASSEYYKGNYHLKLYAVSQYVIKLCKKVTSVSS